MSGNAPERSTRDTERHARLGPRDKTFSHFRVEREAQD